MPKIISSKSRARGKDTPQPRVQLSTHQPTASDGTPGFATIAMWGGVGYYGLRLVGLLGGAGFALGWLEAIGLIAVGAGSLVQGAKPKWPAISLILLALLGGGGGQYQARNPEVSRQRSAQPAPPSPTLRHNALRQQCLDQMMPTHEATWKRGMWALIDATYEGPGMAVVCSPLTDGERRVRLTPGEGGEPGYFWGDKLPSGKLNLHPQIHVTEFKR